MTGHTAGLVSDLRNNDFIPCCNQTVSGRFGLEGMFPFGRFYTTLFGTCYRYRPILLALRITV